MAVYDRYKPTVIGHGFVPLVETETVIDTGTEVGYRFIATEPSGSPLSGANWVAVFTQDPPPGTPARAEVVCRLYGQDPSGPCLPISKVTIPCRAGNGGALVGAATHQAAVANPSDPAYVRLTGASQTARFWFDTTNAVVAGLLGTWSTEIVDVSVLYTVAGPFAEAASTNIVSLGFERQAGPIKRYMDTTVTGPATTGAITSIRRSRLGELCPFWDLLTNPNVEPMRGPWTYRGAGDIGLYALSALGVDNVAVFFETGAAAAGNYDLTYVALQISYRENYHLRGVGGMDLSGGVEVKEGLYMYRCPLMPASTPWDYTGAGPIYLVTVPQGLCHVITVSRAYSGTVSMGSPSPLPLPLIDTVDPCVPVLDGVRITKPIAENRVPTTEFTTQLPAIVLYDADPHHWDSQMVPANVNPAGHAYLTQTVHIVHDSGSYYSVQQIADDTPGAFTWAVFYARASSSVTSGLKLIQTNAGGVPLGPQGYIDYPTWLALPEIINGWRKVIIALSPSAVLAGVGGVTYWRWTTDSGDLRVWEVLGSTANPTTNTAGASSGAACGYHAETAAGEFTGTVDYPLDMTLMLTQNMTAVTGFAVSQLTQTLTTPTHCGVSPSAIPTGIVYNHLAWNPVLTTMVSGWACYEIQRRDTTMDAGVWETIATITNPFVATMDDYESRIGVQSSYRIRTTHVVGVSSAWSATVTSTIAAPGVTGSGCDTGLLAMTTNEDPLANLAYIHVSGTPEEFSFIEAGWGTLEARHDRNYQLALRPPERGGVTFDRSVLVNKIGIPTGTLDRGFTGLRDLAWDQVPYVCVRDELANRWLVNAVVPSGTVSRQDAKTSYYQVARVSMTEVSDEPFPHDAPLPYLGIYEPGPVKPYADLAVCTPFATIDDMDIRVKFVILEVCGNAGFTVLRYDNTGPLSWWLFGYAADGRTYFDVLGAGGSFSGSVSTIVPIIRQPLWARCVYDHDDGLGTSTMTFYSSLDGVVWTNHGTITGGPATLVPSAGREFNISAEEQTAVMEAIVIDVATATVAMSPDFEANQTSPFVDAQGNTWDYKAW